VGDLRRSEAKNSGSWDNSRKVFPSDSVYVFGMNKKFEDIVKLYLSGPDPAEKALLDKILNRKYIEVADNNLLETTSRNIG
jgi:hypothetical protein